MHRFEYATLQVAFVGTFPLVEGDVGTVTPQLATVVVESMDPILAALEQAGAEILEGPGEVPNGLRVLARHPDGSVFEYMRRN